MKKSSMLTIILILLSCSTFIAAQQKTKAPVKRVSGRNLIKPIPKPKVEVENWKEFEFKDLNLKLIFPKEPTVTVSNYSETSRVKVISSVIQSIINTDYYMVEVREYPAGVLPNRTDLGESYGAWLRNYVLSGVNVVGENTFNFGAYKMVEFVYQQTPNDVLIHRTMVVGTKLYQIIIQFEVRNAETFEQVIAKNKSKIDKFFLSLELTEEQFIS
ncbi:MAG TPA: hypothetical protein VGC97_02265 [Pyrinomonadaceae bacterium]|jgi:hypothetical protein